MIKSQIAPRKPLEEMTVGKIRIVTKSKKRRKSIRKGQNLKAENEAEKPERELRSISPNSPQKKKSQDSRNLSNLKLRMNKD